MEMKFTPGPWSAGGTKPYKGNEAWIFDSSTPEKLICFLGGEIDKPRPSIPESLANAHLIAAAPDLYAALLNIFKSPRGEGLSVDLVIQMHEALDKATPGILNSI